ncbi:unnamed protein product [Heligmosomoides polygyrus]|uniref:Methuselah_N domain-containing protein n=1 Tax=Heligmosomoides polygyrus TaxID=6339 RepID=A0A183GWC4_HELPZ|nr:unnamed protein product [Heligmosomoides polygyrus]
MYLDVDFNGGIFQCHVDQYSCESVCAFQCWKVKTCEHRATSTYVCIPQPKLLIVSFVVWIILTTTAAIAIGYSCWKLIRWRCCGMPKVHAGLIRSVSDLETRVQASGFSS